MEPGARTRRIALLVRGINVDHIGKDETDESKEDFHAEFLSRGSRGLHNCDRRLEQQVSSQKAMPAELLKHLSSDEPVVRNDAVEKLPSNPDALRDPKIKTALVNLLDKENHVRFSEDDEG